MLRTVCFANQRTMWQLSHPPPQPLSTHARNAAKSASTTSEVPLASWPRPSLLPLRHWLPFAAPLLCCCCCSCQGTANPQERNPWHCYLHSCRTYTKRCCCCCCGSGGMIVTTAPLKESVRTLPCSSQCHKHLCCCSYYHSCGCNSCPPLHPKDQRHLCCHYCCCCCRPA